MSPFRVLFAGAAALLGVGLYAGLALFPGGPARPRSFRDVDPAAEAVRTERLDAQHEALGHCLAVRAQVHADLAEGRLTLREAVALLREEDAGRRPPLMHVRINLFPGRDDEERWCRAAIFYVQSTLEGDPRRDAVVARLDAELQDVLAASGGRQPLLANRPR
jgi:hypothetical protein